MLEHEILSEEHAPNLLHLHSWKKKNRNHLLDAH